MSDHNPGSADRKFALIAPFVVGAAAVVVLGAVLIVPARDRAAAPEPVEASASAPPSAPSKAAESAEHPAKPTAARADLIAAAAQAADAFSLGRPEPLKDWVGRSFSVAIAFGCAGPSADPGSAQAFYQFDPGASSVRLVARAATWTDLPLLGPATNQAETVEGFWIPRPWMTQEACPTRRSVQPPAIPTPVEGPTLGLAVVHAADASRLERRGSRPYDHQIKLATGAAPPASGYRLRLAGRVNGFEDGAAIRCWSESADHRPVCLFAVTLERVAFEAADGQVLADWPR
jgi:hypothetical protein